MNAFFIKQNNVLKKIPYDTVLWIKAEGNYSMVHIDNKRYVLKISLKKVLEQLPSDRFLQIHRAHIVDVLKIDDIDMANSELTVNGGHKLPIGRSYKDDLIDKINIVK